ncbi:Membrane-bound lysozyme inhibitor of c-type lysozyme MliC [uncultured Gammaproteobacteria bacterium]
MNVLEVAIYALVMTSTTMPFTCEQGNQDGVVCSNGISAAEDGEGHLRYSNGLTVLKDRQGGIAFSNGVTTHFDAAGWVKFSSGISVRRETLEKYRFSNGMVCRLMEPTRAWCVPGK